LDWFIWFLQSLVLAFYNFGYVVTHPMQWLDWSNGKSVMRFIYYGASAELFFVCLAGFLLLTCVGMLRNSILWVVVRSLEWIANTVGRMAAWAGLLMVLQQIVIVFVQRIFLEAQITFGLGVGLDKDISWYAEELKFYNAIIVCLCAAYTFVQGGHVRVDLVYAAVSDSLQRLVDGKSRAFKWNVETIGFSPNGFNAYFLFKVLLVVFCAMIILQAVAFFYRSYLEMKEGQASEGKYLDRDVLGDEQALVV
jgi:hypothetical protein